MKKIFTLIFGLFAAFSLASTAGAAYTYPSYTTNSNYTYCGSYGYYNCATQTVVNSYYYTSGCYTYYYNGYTRTTSVVSYNCQTTSYAYPVTYTYSYPYSQYQTYGYHDGTWYPGYSSNIFTDTGYNNYYYDNYYNNNYGYNYSYCYWQNGYQICQ